MIYTRKGKNKKFASTKKIPPDERSLLQKCKRTHLVSYSYYNCLENDFVPLNPEHYGWIIENDELKPISYEGDALPTIEQYAQAVSTDIYADEDSCEENEGKDDDDDESSCSDDEVSSAEEEDDSDDDLM